MDRFTLQILVFLCLSLAGIQHAFARAPFWGNLTLIVDAAHDSNVSQGREEQDILDDKLYEVRLAFDYNQLITESSSWTIEPRIRYIGHEEFDGLDQLSLGLSGIYRFQPELGYTQPFYQISLSVEHNQFDAEQRDNTRYVFQLFQTRRITDRLRGTLGLEYSNTQADSPIFEAEAGRWFISGDLKLSNRFNVYSTYSTYIGDVVSSVLWPDGRGNGRLDIRDLVRVSDERGIDQALQQNFNPDGTSNFEAIAYQVDAISHVFTLGSRWRLAQRLSLDISVTGALVKGEGNADYDRIITRAGLMTWF